MSNLRHAKIVWFYVWVITKKIIEEIADSIVNLTKKWQARCFYFWSCWTKYDKFCKEACEVNLILKELREIDILFYRLPHVT